MPRPGPRPYECVRRAWHSDRHQPIRGSLIQDIFRIAHEIHSLTTKKKKEWQEKLPIVVLKAEEIMYSKANSEAEYMDPKTLWDRTNDAINTIIRRDESSEEAGEFLQPCIEAALHLGCVPRRTSRSQRNNHPRCYLTGNTDFTPATEANAKPSSSVPPPFTNFLGKEPHIFGKPINSCFLNEMHYLSSQTCLAAASSSPSKSYPVYPLYYGVYSQSHEPKPNLGGMPTLYASNKGNLHTGVSQALPSCNEEYNMSRRDSQMIAKDQPIKECDLSLRLGVGSMARDEDAGSNGFEGKRLSLGLKQPPKDGFSLYCGNSTASGDGFLNVELMVKKRKAVEQMNNQRYPWQPKVMSAYSKEGTRNAGL